MAVAEKSADKELSAGFTGPSGVLTRFIQSETGHKNMLQLIHLRWLALVGQIATLAIAKVGFGLDLPMPKILVVLILLAAFNIGSHLRWHEERVATERELFLSLLVDAGGLTALLYFTGGTDNPFAFLYLLQIILSAVLLKPATSWWFVMVTLLCLAGLSVFRHPLNLPTLHLPYVPSLYIQGLLICFALDAILLVMFITRIQRNLRSGDRMLSDLKQRAAEEEHIVRMGLLASGAAHELGTPLATVSVILNDWKRLPAIKQSAEMLEDIEEMQSQLLRCKSIVSGILMSAGETRGESSSRTTLSRFFGEIASQWQDSRSIEVFEYTDGIQADQPMAADTALKQVMFNLLDNALETSSSWIGMSVWLDDDHLVAQVRDKGPGFKADILDQLGKPYNSSKDKPCSGLGLFLVTNVVRRLGGSLSAENPPEGGAQVRVVIPLNALVLNVPSEVKPVNAP